MKWLFIKEQLRQQARGISTDRLSGCDAVGVSNAAYVNEHTKTGDNVSLKGQSWVNSCMVWRGHGYCNGQSGLSLSIQGIWVPPHQIKRNENFLLM